MAIEHLTSARAEVIQRRIAAGLAERGLADAARVAVVAPSSASLLLTILALLRTGVVPVVVNAALTAPEQAVILADAAPSAVLGPAELEALRRTSSTRDLAPVPLARPMHYTSGTTGGPKGVWTGVLEPDAANRLASEEAELWGFGDDDHHIVCSPLHHSAPLRFAAGTLAVGGSVTILSRFDAAAFARVAREATGSLTSFMVPAHFQRLFTGPDTTDLGRFRLVAHAGAPCPVPLKREALRRFPAGSVWEFYGSTEGQFTACGPEEWLARPGTVGRARPGRSLQLDADGTVWCEVPDHARFVYWNDPEATAAAWRDRSFTVGDVGRLDDEGYLFLDGRRDDLIISGGVNVHPAEVEAALAACPGIVDVAVHGEPDQRWGQRVCAVVVGDVDEVRLRAFAEQHLAPHKRPKRWRSADSLPRTATGKVLRRQLSPSGKRLL